MVIFFILIVRSVCATQLFIHAIDAGVYVLPSCSTSVRLRRGRRSSHKNSTDCIFRVFFFLNWKYSNDFLSKSRRFRPKPNRDQ